MDHYSLVINYFKGNLFEINPVVFPFKNRRALFTNSIIIEEPLHLTSGEARRYIIEKLKQHGIDGNCIAKYGYNGELAESGLM